MLGFEIELLVLVDIAGRPVPEKIALGTYKDQGVGLTVDHQPDVQQLAPVPAGTAPARDVPWKEGTIRLGAYDLGADYRARLVPWGVIDKPLANQTPGFQNLPFRRLLPNAWADTLSRLRYEGCPVGIEEIAGAGEAYQKALRDRDVAAMIPILDGVVRYASTWLAATAPKSMGVGERTTRREVVNELLAEARYHLAFWAKPQFCQADTDAWSDEHPLEVFLGREGYHSILELVTSAYPVEAETGAASLTAAVADATALANEINQLMGTDRQRVKLNGTQATVANAETYVGNPTVERQTVAASIQVTFAVDVAQIPSLFKSLIPADLGERFGLKHHADGVGNLARTEAARSPNVASAILKAVASPDVDAFHDLLELRGLLTIVCQYLLMGQHFFDGTSQLDKNVVPLLSRTDLSHVYGRLVPERGKAWARQHMDRLREEIFAKTKRIADSSLFTDPNQESRGERAPLNLSCGDFVANVFDRDKDGVTDLLDQGIFKKMPAENVHPAGSKLANAPLSGPVFELRNMVPVRGGLGDRFVPGQWGPLARLLISVLTELHSRDDDPAVDLRFRSGQGQREAGQWWTMEA